MGGGRRVGGCRDDRENEEERTGGERGRRRGSRQRRISRKRGKRGRRKKPREIGGGMRELHEKK